MRRDAGAVVELEGRGQARDYTGGEGGRERGREGGKKQKGREEGGQRGSGVTDERGWGMGE